MAETRSIHIKTFGCQMNVYDSDRMKGILLNQGFTFEADVRSADVVILNTCAIRDKSEHKVLSLLGELKPLKEKHPGKIFGVAGCVGQRMGRKLLQRVPHLDLVMGPDSVDRVGTLVSEVLTTGRRVLEAKLDDDKARTYSAPTFVQKTRVSEYLTIMKGCDHFCTYCIVPFVRGREKSRPIPEVLKDVERLVSEGTREIVFLGQNINTYGKGCDFTLAQLIEATNQVKDLLRIRYVTSHPRDLGQDLIDQFGRVEKLCPQLHLPFQSGSDNILKCMSRLYTQAEYLGKVAALRKACPDIALTTDVIVGFPGETEEDFAQTLQVLREVKFTFGYLFKYSPRPGTRAFAMGDSVPESVKTERFDRAYEVLMSQTAVDNEALLGKTIPVLIESIDRKGKFYSGRTPHHKLVHVLNAGEACVGKAIPVEITEANATNLKGYFTDSRKESPCLVSRTF